MALLLGRCRGVLRGRGRWMIRQLPVHRGPDFFPHSPAEVRASLGPPVQAVAPVTLGEHEGDAVASSSPNSRPHPSLLAAASRLCWRDRSEKQGVACGQPKDNRGDAGALAVSKAASTVSDSPTLGISGLWFSCHVLPSRCLPKGLFSSV